MDRMLSLWILVVAGFMLALAPMAAKADGGPFGLGIIVGEPTGFTGEYKLSPKNAVDGGLAYSYERQDAWQIYSDYLFTGNKIAKDQIPEIDLYFGAGARLKFETDTRFGFRFPVGMTYSFTEHPIQAFLEIAPIMDVVPGTDFSINAAIGARFFF